jgi:hypothetical protein
VVVPERHFLSTELLVANCSSFLVNQHPMEVCPLARGAKFEPLSSSLQTGLRFFHRPLPAPPSADLTVRFPKGRDTGLPRSSDLPYRWLRCCLFAGGACVCVSEAKNLSTCPLAFWLKPISAFGLSLITTFSNSSPRFTLPSILAPDHFDASSRNFLSRFGCHLFR